MNQRIREISESFALLVGSYEVLCECQSDDCVERVEVPASVFDRLRTGDGRYVVTPGHEKADLDRVVVEGGTYLVVAAAPAAAALPAA